LPRIQPVFAAARRRYRSPKAFLRWTRGEYEEEERKSASEWRVSGIGFPTADVIETRSGRSLHRGPVELVVDLEGVPDRGDYYLAGLFVCRGSEAEYQSFWADDTGGEAAIWSALVDRLEAFPDAPVYHYGSFEKKAFTTLAKRHGRGSKLADRLVNVASFVYGRVYFPVRSNGLKSLGRLLGAEWTDPKASGLQSLVWRHRWEATRDEQYKAALLRYNREDCEGVRVLINHLAQVRQNAASDPSIEFANQPKQHATEIGKDVHDLFKRILQSAQLAFARRRIRIRKTGEEDSLRRLRNLPNGKRFLQSFHRICLLRPAVRKPLWDQVVPEHKNHEAELPRRPQLPSLRAAHRRPQR
jgi:hypothetical protein